MMDKKRREEEKERGKKRDGRDRKGDADNHQPQYWEKPSQAEASYLI